MLNKNEAENGDGIVLLWIKRQEERGWLNEIVESVQTNFVYTQYNALNYVFQMYQFYRAK